MGSLTQLLLHKERNKIRRRRTVVGRFDLARVLWAQQLFHPRDTFCDAAGNTTPQEKKWDTDTEKQKPDTIRSSANERCEISFL